MPQPSSAPRQRSTVGWSSADAVGVVRARAIVGTVPARAPMSRVRPRESRMAAHARRACRRKAKHQPCLHRPPQNRCESATPAGGFRTAAGKPAQPGDSPPACAAAHAREACRLAPDYAEAWTTLGFVLERTGDREKAVALAGRRAGRQRRLARADRAAARRPARPRGVGARAGAAEDTGLVGAAAGASARPPETSLTLADAGSPGHRPSPMRRTPRPRRTSRPERSGSTGHPR